MKSCCWKGAYPGVETPVTPDVLDGGDVMEGLGVGDGRIGFSSFGR